MKIVAFEFLIFGLFHQCWMRLFLWFSNTVRTLFKIYKLLSKYSTFISWNNCRFFWGVKNRKNSWKCCGFGLLDFLAVNNFDFTRKIVKKKKLGKKLVKMYFWPCKFKWDIFGEFQTLCTHVFPWDRKEKCKPRIESFMKMNRSNDFSWVEEAQSDNNCRSFSTPFSFVFWHQTKSWTASSSKLLLVNSSK